MKSSKSLEEQEYNHSKVSQKYKNSKSGNRSSQHFGTIKHDNLVLSYSKVVKQSVMYLDKHSLYWTEMVMVEYPALL
jgi:hypothetical protein